MQKIKSVALLFSVFALGLAGNTAWADSPMSMAKPDRHSVEVKGKIKVFRVQTQGMNMGEDSDKAEAEVFVTLTTNPKKVYTLQVRSDSPASNRLMADTLRDAYFHKTTVTLYYQLNMKRTNLFKLLMVQLD